MGLLPFKNVLLTTSSYQGLLMKVKLKANTKKEQSFFVIEVASALKSEHVPRCVRHVSYSQ
jgi:hypothetical protein